MQANEASADVTSWLRDAELVDLVNGAQPTQHWLRQLDSKLKVTGNSTIREYLQSQTAFTAPGLAALGEVRASLAHLKDLDTERLAQLMQGTLDLSAHRLDAWITSFATKRLATMQIDGPKGQYVGGYGWLENLRPALPSSVKLVPAPPGETGTLQLPAHDSGFIHAPSMTHGDKHERAPARPPVDADASVADGRVPSGGYRHTHPGTRARDERNAHALLFR